MDIKQLKNFVVIVESNFNISETSKKIHISQPALSQMILSFERDENIQLFERSNGRLKSLTPEGENFYYNAIEVIKQYEEMMGWLREASSKMKGKIKIGIPPVVNTLLFTEIIPRLIVDNPNIQFDIVEMGAFELEKSLILQEIDIAVLVRPSNFMRNNIQEVLIAKYDLCAFMRNNHRLAKKRRLGWEELNNESMALLTEAFMIHHHLMMKFESENIKPNIKFKSPSWDYLLYSIEHSNMITVLPHLISNFIFPKNLVKVEFEEPINCEVTLCRLIKAHHTRVETFIFNSLCKYFSD